jgi:trehalose 6-phosphate synthase
VVASNRGPVSFRRADDGRLEARRGAGGLVSGLAPLMVGTSATWIAAALSDGDREAARQGVGEAEGFGVRLLALDLDDFRMAYDVICNATLWFLHSKLFDLARRPRLDHRWREAWAGYRRVNHAFADAVDDVAPDGAVVLVQDLHLSLVGARLAERRPDLRTVHFSHTPFGDPDDLRVLPTEVRHELLAGLASHHACGFHTRRWARSFEACCEQVLGRCPPTFDSSLGPDPDDIGAVAASTACDDALARLDDELDGRRLILRVDRIELSKNLPRGFHAFDDLLERHPEWRERVVFGAFVYPSREGLAEYLAYRQEVEGLIRQLNERWGSPGWTPVIYDPSDDFPRSIAALRRYDTLLVNPIRDGLNLVAKEGPMVNERDGVLALSTEAGAWEELRGLALEVNPFDVGGTADVLHRALAMGPEERAAHAVAVREAATARRPSDWLADQLAAAEA